MKSHLAALGTVAVLALSACTASPKTPAPATWVQQPASSPLAAPAPSPTASSPAPSPTADVAADIARQVKSYLAASGGHAALALIDRTTGVRITVNDGQRFKTASIVKVEILATVLYKAQKAGRSLTAHQRSLAEQMITASSNSAADELWIGMGQGPALAAANKVFGLTHTTPGQGILWGWTETTVGDQLKVLAVLTEPTSPLTKANRDYILGLMSHVHGDQQWGISAAATDAGRVWLKNGWLATSTDDNLWIVNSIGRIVEPGHDFLVVALSYHRTSEDKGITVVEHAAKLAVSTLRDAT